MAERFTIEFDPRSFVSSAQDTFTFTDSNDIIHTHTSKTLSTLPINHQEQKKIELISNTYLQFCLPAQTEKISFLRFTISAHGYDKLTSKIFLSDLLESLTCLCARHLSRVYYSDRFSRIGDLAIPMNYLGAKSNNDKQEVSKELLQSKDPKPSPLSETNDDDVPSPGTGPKIDDPIDKLKPHIYDLNSDFYRILFRGGQRLVIVNLLFFKLIVELKNTVINLSNTIILL